VFTRILAFAMGCAALSGPALEAGRQAVDSGIAWRGWHPGQAPPPDLFGVRSFEPASPAEAEEARALALRALTWLGIGPDTPPAGARLAYRIEGGEGWGGFVPDSLARVDRALGGGRTPGGAASEVPAEITGWVLTGRALDLRLASGAERMRLSLREGRTRLRVGPRRGEPVKPGAEDVRFAGRRVRNFHPGVWLALALRPDGHLRLPGPEPGRPGVVRLLAALPDGEAMEYVIDPILGRLLAERAWAQTAAGMGRVTGWIGRYRAVDGIQVPWTWTSERDGRPVARGQVLRWAWSPEEGDEHGPAQDAGR
jgi:hypothetical protein